jgi:hypothetical protein
VADIVALLWFFASGIVLVATGIQAARLFYRFKREYPEIAEREIPYAFEGIRHPEQFLFFYRRRGTEVFRTNPRLLRMKSWLTILLTLSAIVPFGGFVVVIIVVRFLARPG